MASKWQEPSEKPIGGDSIWVVVREHDGIHYHVDYGVVFDDVDGLIIRRFETDEYEQWPPHDVTHWTECDIPILPRGLP